MAKQEKTVWFCNNCGAESSKWVGRCPGCGEWNTMIEEKVRPAKGGRASAPLRGQESVVRPISQIETHEEQRISMPSGELNRVLGGGLVAGSLVLIGGEPGIGKSTLVLQNILSIRQKDFICVGRGEREPIEDACRPHRASQRQLLHRVRDFNGLNHGTYKGCSAADCGCGFYSDDRI